MYNDIASIERKGPRPAPSIGVAQAPEGWHVIDANWDYWQEALALSLHDATEDQLDAARREAREYDLAEGKGRALIRLGAEEFQVAPFGMKGGIKTVMENQDLIVMVRGGGNEWPVSIRVRAAALWAYGLDHMRSRVAAVARTLGVPRGRDWRRLSRADLAVDIWAPSFGAEMKPALLEQVVQPGSGKVYTVGRAGRLETITLGRVTGVQTTIYDKGKEVQEVPAKGWMRRIWAKAGRPDLNGDDPVPARKIWRVEVRFGKEYLKARALNEPDLAIKSVGMMMTEGLKGRRLTKPLPGDANRRRWPLHPLFGLAWEMAGGIDQMPPYGRFVMLETRADKSRQYRDQLQGSIRALTVLEGGGDYTPTDTSRHLVALQAGIERDEKHMDKVIEARERFRYLDWGS